MEVGTTGGWTYSVPPLSLGGSLSLVTSVSRATTFLGREEVVVGAVGPSYATPLLVVIALASPLGLAIVLLGNVPEPEGRSFKDFLRAASSACCC